MTRLLQKMKSMWKKGRKDCDEIMFCETNLIVVKCKQLQHQRRFKVKWKRKKLWQISNVHMQSNIKGKNRQMCMNSDKKRLSWVSEKCEKSLAKKRESFSCVCMQMMTQRLKLFYGLLGAVVGLCIGTFLKSFNTMENLIRCDTISLSSVQWKCKFNEPPLL